MFIILSCMQWYLTVVLICIHLLFCDFEHLFTFIAMCLFAVFHSLLKDLLKCFCSFLKLGDLTYNWVLGSLCILDPLLYNGSKYFIYYESNILYYHVLNMFFKPWSCRLNSFDFKNIPFVFLNLQSKGLCQTN
jgi:hypothetical protein